MTNLKNEGGEEAEATIRKTKDGKYVDLSKESLVRQEQKHLDHSQLMNLFERLRLRFTLTPQCNLWCFFCSNEGSCYEAKKQEHADIGQVIKLGEMIIENTPLKSIDFSGGEPLLHPDFNKENSRLIEWTKKYPHIRFSVHSNGTTLSPKIIDQVKGHFSRIGISVNSFHFPTWNLITNTGNNFPQETQKKKFQKMISNIEYLADQGIGEKVFMKMVVMRGINSSEKQLEDFLEKCERYNFHPKFLEFEPQYKEQKKYVIKRKELFDKLERIGCQFPEDAPRHNDPKTYIPGVNFQYGKCPIGLHSIFECGTKAACESCYSFLCMFVKPSSDGRGLHLKPCSVLDTKIDLTHALRNDDVKQLIELFRVSREYLMLAPGISTPDWNKEEDYNPEK